MLGTGAYAAANAGALKSLRARGIEPYAVCGMHMGAWIAGLHLCGYDESEMEAAISFAAGKGRRLIAVRRSGDSSLIGRERWSCSSMLISRMIHAQLGERLLGLCDRRGVFLCRSAANGRRVVFSTRPYAQGTDVSLMMQASVAFAARAAMAQPPFISSMTWLGSPLIPEENPAYAVGQLLRMGADGVLVVEPRASASHEPDALELCPASRRWALEENLPERTGILRIMMPTDMGALSFKQMPRIAEAAFAASQTQLDGVLSGMGMAACRVLPFRTRAEQISRRC